MYHPKKYFVFILLIGIFLALPAAAYAQDSGGFELPGTAVEAITLLAGLVAAIWGGGHLGNFFTDLLKRIKWGVLSDGQKNQLGGMLAEVTAFLLSIGSAFVLSHFLLPLGAYLDQNGLYPILISAWPVARVLTVPPQGHDVKPNSKK